MGGVTFLRFRQQEHLIRGKRRNQVQIEEQLTEISVAVIRTPPLVVFRLALDLCHLARQTETNTHLMMD